MEYNLQPQAAVGGGVKNSTAVVITAQAAVGGGVKNSSAVVVTVESMGIPF